MSMIRYVRFQCEFCGGSKDVELPANQVWTDRPLDWIAVERKPGLPQRADFCSAECAARSFYNPPRPSHDSPTPSHD